MHLRHHISVLLVTCALGSVALARQPVSAVCTTDPLVSYAGATISVHVTPDGFLPQRNLTYTYSSTDGEVTGDGASTGTVNTTGLQPGNYNVSSLVSDDHKPKRTLVATCQASFTIQGAAEVPSPDARSRRAASGKLGRPGHGDGRRFQPGQPAIELQLPRKQGRPCRQ